MVAAKPPSNREHYSFGWRNITDMVILALFIWMEKHYRYGNIEAS
jgi:hypothetical protein